RPDKGQPEQADQHAAVADLAQGSQHAADLVRLARIAVERGRDQKAADQRDRGAAAGDAVSRDRPDQPLLPLRQCHLAIDIANDAPNEKPGAADQHSRSDNPDQQAAVIPGRQPGNPGLDVAVAAAPPEAERDPGDIDHKDEIDTGVADQAEPAPPASSAGTPGGGDSGYREPAGEAGEAERDRDQEDGADRMPLAELPRAELDSIARAGRAMGRPDRGNGRRGANQEIH